MLKDLRLFYSEFRRNFVTTGAIAPSSPLLAKAMVFPLKQRSSSPIRVLEVGAGTGAVTQQLLKQLRSGDTLDIYELNPRFFGVLRENLPIADLTRQGLTCRLHNADVRSLPDSALFDFIISGLPFNNFESQIVEEFFETFMNHLLPGGTLAYFEYIGTREFQSRLVTGAERERLVRVGIAVKSFLQKYQYDSNQVWWNLPPAKARYCRKASSLEKPAPPK
ncbi:MAG: methyltransferase domain-containing protein [Terriglobia bacterium]